MGQRSFFWILALLVPFPTLREWAYAGLTLFDDWSGVVAHGAAPVIATLVLTLVSYWLWRGMRGAGK